MARQNWRGLSRQTAQVIPGVANNVIPEVMLSAKSEEVMRAFMPVFVERLKRNLATQHIGHEGDLDDSLRFNIRKGQNMVSANLSFNFYGRFVDMGVGKGTTLMERQTGRPLMAGRAATGNKRRPKPWFSPQYVFEKERLAQIMTESVAELATMMAGINDDSVTLTI
jgi:hypothetical protein